MENPLTFIALDFETANEDLTSVCQVGISTFTNGIITNTFKTYIDPRDEFSFLNIAIHGITPEDVVGSPTIEQFFPFMHQMLGENIIVHYTHFEKTVINQIVEKYDLLQPQINYLDASVVVRRTWEEFSKRGYGLGNIAEFLGIEFNHHDALEDSIATGKILIAAIEKTGINIGDWFDQIRKRKKLPRNYNYQPSNKFDPNAEGDFYGEHVIFTGTLSQYTRTEARNIAASVGFEAPDTTVTKKTTMLVVGIQDIQKLKGQELSSKNRDALKYINLGFQIRIISEKDFYKFID